ncbi:3-oxoacyl-[acyl-carrier protein] reductase [Rhizobium sp. SJZ105]|uniref:SDR family NAD(P)-dependent oxidoreductase n=1 Tax=Rhizobium sp. SJZ105 TaxID=2572678 RepID=UPI00119CE5D4|nr:SDR family oxidoreductase [Rhizobium sp. SJZ105]TWC76338.1 3-oxoacyl-[acyl-carrier protein] reductase [Rhizobium sp. SJZ105]
MRILVIGASSGLGEQISKAALEREHSVVGTFNSNGGDSLLHLDVTNEASVEKGVKTALERLGGIDALVYCSAIDRPKLTGQADMEDWKIVLDVNLLGAVRVTKAILPHYIRQGFGIFQYISSGLASRSNFGTASYAASKAGLNAFARGVSKEYASKGIRSYTVMPGFIDCGFINYLSPVQRSRVETMIDCKRIANPAEIAGFCLGVLENSSYLSATDLEIHGGLM